VGDEEDHENALLQTAENKQMFSFVFAQAETLQKDLV